MKFADYDWKNRDLPPCAELYEDVRTRAIRAAMASFERNRVPGVAYDNGDLVERDGSFFIEWKPVGFERVLTDPIKDD